VTGDALFLLAALAMREGRLADLGELFRRSHASLRDDYEVSVREVDILVELAAAEPSVHGARITGGGFGGCVVLLTNAGEEREVAERVARAYRERTGQDGRALVPEPTGP
jgi:galactokinase